MAPLMTVDWPEFTVRAGERVVRLHAFDERFHARFPFVAVGRRYGLAFGLQVVLVGPFIPNMDIMVDEVPDIGAALQKPQEFVCNFVKGQFLCCHQRKAVGEVKSQLLAEATNCARAGAIGTENTLGSDLPKAV